MNNNNVALLDCTLRDGGYINEWNFGQNTLVNVFERLVSANIDYIEVGFLDQRQPFNINRSIMPDTKSVEMIYGNLCKGNTQVVAMIDYGTCDIAHIQPQAESFLDGIRVIFKKHIMHEALAFCRELKQQGYKIFTQVVSITSYNDSELLELTDLVNDVKPFAVSIVDTYGLLHKNKLFHYYEVMNAHLDEHIGIGYHSHNNFQLGYANCIELAGKHAAVSKRRLLLDGSVFGMGKGAGNAPTELLAMHMNDKQSNYRYDISQILEAIDINILEIFKQSPWGYSMKFFIAASNDCHPNYVSYLLEKQTLSVKSINEVLKEIDEKHKLLFNKAYIEQLYVDYQKHACNDKADYEALSAQLNDKKVLIIGPGVSIKSEADRIEAYVKAQNPLIIAINFIPEKVDVKYLFLTNSKRYVRQATLINKLGGEIKIIATSNVTKSAGKFDYNLDYETLIDRSAVFMDNSFIMLMKVMVKSGVREVALAGFDGYSYDRETNYYSSEMEYRFAKQKGEEINADVNKNLRELKKRIDFKFITNTLYKA
ncbi:MAG: aldolase catalytic domain-containing protein [Oscillospiraceae bacterium]|jgi:4-hydroxy 2-oxovalerate aldolase|nr:aldolase catalytic domain-containing protein [Oscillospiraceae bacterium]